MKHGQKNIKLFPPCFNLEIVLMKDKKQQSKRAGDLLNSKAVCVY